MMPYINRCPNYLHLLIWSMQTYIKTWWTLKCSHHTPIFDDFNWPHLFWVFPVFTANKKVWFPGEAIHGRNICSDYKCSLRLCVWLYSQQLSSFYSKYLAVPTYRRNRCCFRRDFYYFIIIIILCFRLKPHSVCTAFLFRPRLLKYEDKRVKSYIKLKLRT